MNNSSQREELIEKYISGEMSAEDLRSFENEMDADSELKEEVSFQKDVITALQMERRAALKARMDNVKIPSPYSTYYTAGIASVVLVAGVVFLSTLWPLDSNMDMPVSEQMTEKAEELKTETEQQQEIESPVEIEQETGSEYIEPNRAPIENTQKNTLVEKEIIKDEVQSSSANENRRPNIVTPTAPEPSSDQGITTSDLEKGNDELLTSENRATSKVEVEVKTSDSYNFHYQYFNNKLFLYGDFSKSPYELIELNANDSKNLYMYFNSKYYSLQSNQIEVAKLSPMRDKIIIRGLDNLRLR